MIESALPSKETLLSAAQEGDIEAFNALHAGLESDIGRFVRRLAGGAPEWEDLVQETFIALFINLKRVQGVNHLRPYTFTIARNVCTDWRRRQKATISIDADDPLPVVYTLRDDTLPPDEVTHWLLMSVEVQHAIERLPAPQREALILFSEYELTYAEIAERIGISIGTVKSRIFHAKKTLRGLIRPEILLALQEEDEENHVRTTNSGETPTLSEGAESTSEFH